MAGASDKKLAVANVKSLKEIHLLSLSINITALIALFVLKRPGSIKPYFLLSIPSLIAQYVIETTGRPKYGGENGTTLLKAGQDLKQSGVTEYLFDIIYVTLLIDILMIIFGSNKVWYLYLCIPGYVGYMLFGLLKGGKKLLSGMKGGENAVTAEPVKSKRQAKLEARSGKQQQKVRSR